MLLGVPEINVNLATYSIPTFTSFPDHGKVPPVMLACNQLHPKIVMKFLKHEDIDLSVKDLNGETILHYAASCCATSTKALTKIPDLNWNEGDNFGKTPLWWGLNYGQDEVVKILISLSNINYDVRTKEGETLATRCVTSDHENHLKCLELLTDVVHVDWNIPDKNGDTPILWCVKNNQIQKIKILLKCPRVDPNVKDLQGNTCALFALKNDKMEAFEMLIKNNRTEINVKDTEGS